MNPSDEHEIHDRARAALDARAAGLDGATRSRLNQARQRAVAAAHAAPATRWLPWRIAGAAAAVCAVTLTALLMREPAPELPVALPDDDVELLALDADLELIEEVEFYHWLEDTSDGSDPA
ncbi:MAG: hypothetical protein QNJ91_14025 [Gammaproteobacteria bacterium]|nr:hypothetical protein [Gammaproteobacteria bacterium]